MRVVIATPFYPPQTGVLATYAAGIESAFKKKGYDVSVVTFSSSLPAGLRHAAYAIRLARLSRGASFVLALDMWSVGIPAHFVARMLGVPLMFRIGGDQLWEYFVERTGSRITLTEFHTSPPRLNIKERLIRRLFRNMLGSARHVFFNSDFQKRLWEGTYMIPIGKTSLLENYYPAREVAKPPINRMFVAAGRGASIKNHSIIEKVFQRLRARFPDVSLDTSVMSHADHLKRISSCYAIIIPSISEASSNAAIEAVTRGRPFVMSSDTGTIDRLVNYGLFIDTRSETALEDAIETLLDPVAYDQLASKARVFSFTHSWDEIADEIAAQAPAV